MKLDKSNQRKQAKKSITSVLYELKRLKSQQKYLECSQVKLNPDNFVDSDDGEYSPLQNITSSQSVASIINEIEHLKEELDADFKTYRENKRREVRDLWSLVTGIKEDVQQPERLNQISINAIQERIIKANIGLERLIEKNRNELSKLREAYSKLESETPSLLVF